MYRSWFFCVHVDREWISKCRKSIWRRWSSLCVVGGGDGCWTSNWCPMVHVQARWCSRSCCKFCPYITNSFILLFLLVFFQVFHKKNKFNIKNWVYILIPAHGVFFCSQNHVCSLVVSSNFNEFCHYLNHRLETMLVCLLI